MSIIVSALIALIGLIIYFASSGAKVQEVGRVSFFCGLLVTLLQSGREVVGFFK